MPARMFSRSALMLAITLTTPAYLFAENTAATPTPAQGDQPLKPAVVERAPDIGSKNTPVNDVDNSKTGTNSAEPVSAQTEQALQNAEKVVDNCHRTRTLALPKTQR